MLITDAVVSWLARSAREPAIWVCALLDLNQCVVLSSETPELACFFPTRNKKGYRYPVYYLVGETIL